MPRGLSRLRCFLRLRGVARWGGRRRRILQILGGQLKQRLHQRQAAGLIGTATALGGLRLRAGRQQAGQPGEPLVKQVGGEGEIQTQMHGAVCRSPIRGSLIRGGSRAGLRAGVITPIRGLRGTLQQPLQQALLAEPTATVFTALLLGRQPHQLFHGEQGIAAQHQGLQAPLEGLAS